MTVRDEQRAQAIEQIAVHLLRTGLAATSLRQLAAAAGVSDRMLLYYFEDKAEVLAQAMARITEDLAGRLAAAIPADAALAPAALIAAATRITTGRELKPYMRLWIEVVAAAARDETPYTGFARQIAAGFLQWIESRLAEDEPRLRQATAAMILSMVDGLALLEVCAGDDLTQRAASQMANLALLRAHGA